MSGQRDGFRIPEQLLLPWSSRYTISAERAADMLDVARRTVLRLLEDGTLKGYQVRPGRPGSPWRINYDSVVEYIEKIHKDNGLEKRF